MPCSWHESLSSNILEIQLLGKAKISVTKFSYFRQTGHEFHETCDSLTLYFMKKKIPNDAVTPQRHLNSHQRWKQTRFRVCFHLWCELTSTMNVTAWHVSWNSFMEPYMSYCIKCSIWNIWVVMNGIQKLMRVIQMFLIVDTAKTVLFLLSLGIYCIRVILDFKFARCIELLN